MNKKKLKVSINESSYYPDVNLWIGKKGDRSTLYYVEFGRGGHPREFTLFKRQFIHSEEDMARYEKECHEDFKWIEMSNEGHPWNIYTATYGPDGCMPDRAWVCWMVDSLNEKVTNELREQKRKEYYASLPEDPNLPFRP